MTIKISALNIAFITPWYPTPERPMFGTFVHEHAKAVRQQGMKVTVFHLNIVKGNVLFKRNVEVEEVDNVKLIRINLESFLSDVIYHWPSFQLRILKKTVKSYESQLDIFDIIHTHVIYPAGFIGSLLAKNWNLPLIHTEHWSKTKNWIDNTEVKNLNIFKNKVSYILPVSDYLSKIFMESDFENPIRIIPNVVDTELFKPHISVPVNYSKLIKQILCVTNFNLKKPRDKRPEILVKALLQLPEEIRKEIKIIFAGRGLNRELLAKKCKQAKVEAEFPGYLDKSEIAKYMRESDVLMHPTDKETFGVVLAEALCSGLYVIASDVPAHRELIKNGCGKLVKINDVESWKAELITLAQEEKPEISRECIEKARSRFSPESIGKEIVKVYRAVNQS